MYGNESENIPNLQSGTPGFSTWSAMLMAGAPSWLYVKKIGGVNFNELSELSFLARDAFL